MSGKQHTVRGSPPTATPDMATPARDTVASSGGGGSGSGPARAGLPPQPPGLRQPWRALLDAELASGNNPWLDWKPDAQNLGDKPWLSLHWEAVDEDGGSGGEPASESDLETESSAASGTGSDDGKGGDDDDKEKKDKPVHPEMISGYSVGDLRDAYRRS